MRVEPDDPSRPEEDGEPSRTPGVPDGPAGSSAPADEPPGPPSGAPSDAPADPPRRAYWDDDRRPTPPAPPQELSVVLSPRPRLRAARIAVWITSVLLLLDAVVSLWGFDEVRRAIGSEERGSRTPLDDLDGEATAVDALNAVLDVQSALLVVSGLAFIAAAVFVIRWQNVAMHNLRALGVHARYSPVKAAWSWFIPIWFLFGPKRAYNDAWRAAEPEGASSVGRAHWVRRSVPGVFQAWWAAWLIAFFVNWRTGFSDPVSLGDQRSSFVLGGLSSLAIFVAGPLFVIVMERITDRHDERRAEGRAAVDG